MSLRRISKLSPIWGVPSSSSSSSSSSTALISYSKFKCKITLNWIHYFAEPMEYRPNMLKMSYGVIYTISVMEPGYYNNIIFLL